MAPLDRQDLPGRKGHRARLDLKVQRVTLDLSDRRDPQVSKDPQAWPGHAVRRGHRASSDQ